MGVSQQPLASHVEDLNGRRSDDNYVPHLGSLDELNWFQTRRVRNTALTLCASNVQGREDGRNEKENGPARAGQERLRYLLRCLPRSPTVRDPYRVASALASTTADLRAASS